MKAMTKANLEAAFAGESQAHMKYMLFSEKAEREGLKEVARLFKAIAYAEKVHASNHLRALRGVGNTAANLEAARMGEHYEVTEMYPSFDVVAKQQAEKKAVQSINYALEAEKIHEVMYDDAKSSVEAGKDIEPLPIYVCPVCGHTVIGEPPDECPVCDVAKDKYIRF
jgi:rubrerythrin